MVCYYPVCNFCSLNLSAAVLLVLRIIMNHYYYHLLILVTDVTLEHRPTLE